MNPSCPVTRNVVSDDERSYLMRGLPDVPSVLSGTTRAENILLNIPEVELLPERTPWHSRLCILYILSFSVAFCAFLPLHGLAYLGLYIQSKELVKYFSRSVPEHTSLACWGVKFTTFPYMPLTCSWLNNSLLFAFIHGFLQAVLVAAVCVGLLEFPRVYKCGLFFSSTLILYATVLLQMTVFAGSRMMGGSILTVIAATLNLRMNIYDRLNMNLIVSSTSIIFTFVSDASMHSTNLLQLLYAGVATSAMWGAAYTGDRLARLVFRSCVCGPVVLFLCSLSTHFKYYISA